MEIATRVLILTVGGACGVNARYWLSLLVARWLGVRFPWATVAINISGSFAIGMLAVVLADRWPHPHIRIFALTGFLGGYTTFSAYMLESATLWERGDRTLATGNLVGSVVLGLGAVTLGMTLGRWLVEPSVVTATSAVRSGERLKAIGEALAGADQPADPAK